MAEIHAHLHKNLGVLKPGVVIGVLDKLVFDNQGHFAGHPAIFHRAHFCRAPVFIAQLKACDLRRPIGAIQRIAHKPAQCGLVYSGVAMAQGIGFGAQRGAGGQNNQRRAPGIGCELHEFGKRQQGLRLAGDIMQRAGLIGVGDVEIPLGERATGIAHRVDAQLIGHIIIGAIWPQPVAGGQNICTKIRGANFLP